MAQQPLIGSVWLLTVEGHMFMGFQSLDAEKAQYVICIFLSFKYVF